MENKYISPFVPSKVKFFLCQFQIKHLKEHNDHFFTSIF